MYRSALIISFSILVNLSLRGQLPMLERLQLIESSYSIAYPRELVKELIGLKDNDSVGLITFSKSSGKVLGHVEVTKKDVLNELKKTGFEERYFVLLIDKKAIFYLDR